MTRVMAISDRYWGLVALFPPCGKLKLGEGRMHMEETNQYKIVYIEDDPEMIDLVTLILNRQGCQITGANGGRSGLELVKSQAPDLVLLDLMMPDMDGWDVYQQLKSSLETRDIPVIIITAKAQNIDRVLGLHIAKVDDFISKPFRPTELIESINQVMKKKAASGLDS